MDDCVLFRGTISLGQSAVTSEILIRCLHEEIVAVIGRATDRRDDRLV